MQNMMVLESGHIQTAHGIFGDVISHEKHETGEIRSLRLSGKNMVLTHAGELVPAYSETERRKYKPSVEFHRNGMIKAVSLEEQQDIETPIGELPAELLTFYDTGELCRVFPLDGKISGFWSEEDEKNLLIPLDFDLGFTQFSARLSAISFFRDGAIRSITIYPEERITVSTNYGTITVRHGISLYPDGELESFEPAEPVSLDTPIGRISAFDSEAVGITADSNAVRFDRSGNLLSLTTTMHRIGVQTADEKFVWYAPAVFRASPDEDKEIIRSLRIEFLENGVRFNDEECIYSIADSGFSILPFSIGGTSCSPADCASCKLCLN